MTASPPLNGHPRPTMPVLGDWRPATPQPVEEQCTPEPQPEPVEASELVAQAQAEAIRAQAWADAEAKRTAAETAAKAELIKAEEEARKLRLANDRAERKAREEEAASEARIAESRRRREEADRARAQAARQDKEQQLADVDQAKAVEKSSTRWRKTAKGFYALCAAVALPVQMNAFYDPNAEYLLIAPVFIEVIALVALVGAAAAVTAGRPHWHYRLVAWAGALTAASINIVHGLAEYDPATAFGTALASIAGPGMWDLHEHGRIRKRDGKPSWAERRAAKKAAETEAKQKAAEETRKRAEKEAADKAAAKAAEQLAAARAEEFPTVWEHACRLAAALGETAVTEAVWRRAHLDIEGTDPGESAEVIRARNAAAKRVEAARQNKPVNTLSKTMNAQRAIQTPRPSYRPVPPRRKSGDTPRYTPAAGRAHGELLRRKKAAKTPRPNGN